jgi:hypothetical protein
MKEMLPFVNFLLLTFALASGLSIAPPSTQSLQRLSRTSLGSMSASLTEPSKRDLEYGPNVAKYLLDLDASKGTFDFCGGMLFQLMISDALRTHLESVAANNSKDSDNHQQQPTIFDASKSRMFHIPDYTKNADADNIRVFHGRELRKIPGAEGGFGFVLQLSLAGENDPEGWSKEEIDTYDGWGHDSGRVWRKADDYEKEGFRNFKEKFGKEAFGLNHRFYLHYDGAKRMWLSAEDGCEGTPAMSGNPIRRMFGL